MSAWQPVIGLEVHAQLATRTKIFCACSTEFGRPPNSQTCPVCLGHPGALPVLNAKAVELAVRGALALGCTVHETSIFARKNYFYPDLPKGYQISQYEQPVATGGGVRIEVGGEERTIELARLHLEEDAGKSIHEGMPESDRYSYVDLNRSGTPLVEIVSEPHLHSPEEAYLYLQRLKSILRYTEVCDGNMEQGSLRCDANVSVRPAGKNKLGTRCELKNLNSFRNIQRALEYEIRRQIELLEAGGTIVQQTILWDAAASVTRPMREKEEAHDYRYFPDPDLPPLNLDREWIEAIRDGLPELPAARKARMKREYALGESEAQILTLEPGLADYYEEVVRLGGNPKSAANFVLNDLLREQKQAKLDEAEIPLPAARLAELIRLIEDGRVSATAARMDLFPELYRSGRPAAELLDELGLEQMSDDAAMQLLIRDVLAAHPDQWAQCRAGKSGIIGFLVGKVMKASKGKANPRRVNEIIAGLVSDGSGEG